MNTRSRYRLRVELIILIQHRLPRGLYWIVGALKASLPKLRTDCIDSPDRAYADRIGGLSMINGCY